MQLDPQSQSLLEALEWHQIIVESILHHRAATFAEFHAGTTNATSRFFGMSYDEIDSHFIGEREELDRYAVMNIVAATEAAIRLDYLDRVQSKHKDALSRAYQVFHRELSTRAKVRPPFDESGIPDLIKSSGLVPLHLVTNFRAALKLRHWIAHGRYWLLRLAAGTYTPHDAFSAGNDLLAALA